MKKFVIVKWANRFGKYSKILGEQKGQSLAAELAGKDGFEVSVEPYDGHTYNKSFHSVLRADGL